MDEQTPEHCRFFEEIMVRSMSMKGLIIWVHATSTYARVDFMPNGPTLILAKDRCRWG